MRPVYGAYKQCTDGNNGDWNRLAWRTDGNLHDTNIATIASQDVKRLIDCLWIHRIVISRKGSDGFDCPRHRGVEAMIVLRCKPENGK